MRRNTWALVISAEQTETHAGAGVEVSDSFIAEGAWAGDFTNEGLVDSSFRCASGAVIRPDEVILSAPTHSVEPIYCFVQEARVIASNSIHMIVALDSTAAPNSMGKLRAAARTLKAGRINYVRELYETVAGVMHRYAFGNVKISRSTLELVEEHPTGNSTFRDYGEYRELLFATLESLVDNARDPRRRSPYGPVVTTVSSGYDSAACAALGKHLGASEAVTLTAARGNINDTGKPVADALGLSCHEYERFGANLTVQDGESEYAHFLDASHLTSAHTDFLATINSAEDLYFSSFAPRLAGAILLTGFHGDKAWDMRCSSGPETIRGDNSGTGLDEFRKRVGFVNVPVPYIGIAHYAELARICGSDEMAAFRVGGRYDRPLPRRIAEEAGVLRETFGVRKAMGSVLLKNSTPLRGPAFWQLVDEYRDDLAAGI